MKKMKRVLALMLSLLMIVTALPLGAIVSFAQISTASLSADLAFYVPEAIYLVPYSSSWGTETYTYFQYFIENTVNTSSIYTNPTANTTKNTTGHIYFAYPDATSATLSFRYLKADGSVMPTSGTPRATTTNYVTVNSTKLYSATASASSVSLTASSGYYSATIAASSSYSPYLGASDTGCYIEWTLHYVDSADGKTKAAVAYTYVYKPYVVPVGGSISAQNDRGTNSEGGQITYITGIHGIATQGNYYARYTTTSSAYGLLPFQSSDNVAINRSSYYGSLLGIDLSSLTEKSANATRNYSVFASTTASYAYFFANQSGSTYNNINGDAWMVTSANATTTVSNSSTFSVKSFDYFRTNKDCGSRGDRGHSTTLTTTAKGQLYIDSSRYSNLCQIPNLGVGLLVTRDDSSDTGAWYVADYTGRTNSLGQDEAALSGSNPQRVKDNWNDHGTIIARQGDYSDRNASWSAEGVKYAGAWDASVLKSTTTTTYTIRGTYYNYQGGDTIICSVMVPMNTVLTDKSALRTAVQTATKSFAKLGITDNSFSSLYYNTSSTAWSNFVSYYKQAMRELTVVDGSITSSLASNLTSSLNTLLNGTAKYSATATANHYGVIRTLNETGATTGYKVNSTIANETKTYDYSDTLTIASNTYGNYSYQGYAKPTSSNGLNSTFSSANGMVAGSNPSISGRGLTMYENGNDNFNFYYLASDVNLTIDPNGGEWNGSSGTSTVTGSYGSVFTPVNPARSGYTFDKWVLTTSGGGSLGGNTFTFGNSAATLTASWTITDSALNTDTTVIDFSLPVSVTPLANDAVSGQSGISFYGISLSGDSYSTANVTGTYGTFSVNGGTVTYTPSGIMQGADSVHYAVSYTDPISGTVSYAHSTFTVIPATVLYYEDDNSSISYSAGWTTVTDGTAPDVSEMTVDKVYGYSDAYAANSSQYSMNAAKVATVSKTNNKPTATFTFAGTGFDLVSLISKDTGTIEVKVYSGTEATGTPVYDWIVDTYYTYKPETDPDTDTNWAPDNGNTAALYQIPVIGRTDLDYGTYTVVVIPTYSSRLDHEKDGAYDFYLDAIRIYNPCGYDNNEANAVYAADHEKLLAPNQSVYDLLADTLSTDSEINGAVFINTNVTDVTTITDYKSIGPKNEVYLKPGQAIAFNVTANDENARVRISVHSADGNPASMRFGRESGSYTKNITVASCTALYYDVPIEWNNGSGLVIIANTSANDSILSVCDIRITTNQTASVQLVSYTMPTRTFALARTMAYTLTDLTEEDDGLFVPGDVTTEEITEALVSGDSIEVTITTTDDVARLTVNGKDAVCTETADGTKTWTFTYTADETGEQTLELIAYDEYGCTSERTTLTVTVESKTQHFFHNLAKFIKAILELIRTIAKAVEF